jgi:hypothetical protein
MSDPESPEKTENEAWYDAEIAPALAALAIRCQERGMSFIATVEYDHGERAGTYYLIEDVGLEMQMQYYCAMTVPSVDAYIMHLIRHCQREGIDTSGSIVLSGSVVP